MTKSFGGDLSVWQIVMYLPCLDSKTIEPARLLVHEEVGTPVARLYAIMPHLIVVLSTVRVQLLPVTKRNFLRCWWMKGVVHGRHLSILAVHKRYPRIKEDISRLTSIIDSHLLSKIISFNAPMNSFGGNRNV